MQHISLKLFAVPGSQPDLEQAIPVFHRWIQQRAMPELLIDIADYKHVPEGPGVLLIAHEANYSLDLSRGRLGLLYNRKAVSAGDALSNLRQALEAARRASQRLETEPEFQDNLRFSDREIEIVLNDRLLYPNTPETWESLEPVLTQFFDEVYGANQYALTPGGTPRERFRVSAIGRQ